MPNNSVELTARRLRLFVKGLTGLILIGAAAQLHVNCNIISMEQNKKVRLAYIDNLRAMIIMVVVMVHTAVTYSGFGDWYYIENKVIIYALRPICNQVRFAPTIHATI